MDFSVKNFITKTEEKVGENGVKYVTHFVGRPIQPGDPMGGSYGTSVNGVSKTTEVINYVYASSQEKVND